MTERTILIPTTRYHHLIEVLEDFHEDDYGLWENSGKAASWPVPHWNHDLDGSPDD